MLMTNITADKFKGKATLRKPIRCPRNIYKNYLTKIRMKKIFSLIPLLLSINFASAEDLSELLSVIDQSLVVLIALFIIIFSITFFSLKKIFKDDKDVTIAGVIAIAVAFLSVYGINKIQWSAQEFVLSLGVSESAFSLIIFVAIVIGIIYMFNKLKKTTLLVLGGTAIGLSFFVYAKNFLTVVGVMLILSWFLMKVGQNKGKLPTNLKP
jgi:hypothetical protein